MTLLWRVFAVNAAVFVAATLVLVASPATVSFPVALTEALVLVVGLSAVLVLNLLLLRRVLWPLERLVGLMRSVDPLRPGSRVPLGDAMPEIAEVTVAFNDMLDRVEQERRESARRALRAQEAERRRISRELHDEIGQMLTGAMLELDSAVQVGEPAAVEAARETIRASLEEVRDIARRLRPEALDDLGLANAVRGLAATVGRAAQVQMRVTIESPLPELSDDEELVIYRVAQEALANASRYARAETIELILKLDQARLKLVVRDDGRGFDSPTTAGSGIRGMRERAVLIGAELSVASRPGNGTEVRLCLERPAA